MKAVTSELLLNPWMEGLVGFTVHRGAKKSDATR